MVLVAGACDLWRGPLNPEALLSKRANDTRDVLVNMVADNYGTSGTSRLGSQNSGEFQKKGELVTNPPRRQHKTCHLRTTIGNFGVCCPFLKTVFQRRPVLCPALNKTDPATPHYFLTSHHPITLQLSHCRESKSSILGPSVAKI